MAAIDDTTQARLFQVADLTLLAKFGPSLRQDRDMILVFSEACLYTYSVTSALASDSPWVIVPDSGVGRFLRFEKTRMEAVDTLEVEVETLQSAWPEAKAVVYQGNRTVAQLNALTPTEGDAYGALSAGTPTAGTSDALVIGDLAEYDGSQWKKIASASGGFLPSGLVVIVGDGTLVAPLTNVTDRKKLATFGGASNTPALTVPTDGDVRSITSTSRYGGRVFQYDTSGGWEQISSPLSSVTPTSVADAAAAGSSLSASRSDHTHLHGNLAGGAYHAAAVDGGASGFMTGAQVTKLAGIEAAADVTDQTNVLAALAVGATAKDMGGGAITNVGLVDGVDLSALDSDVTTAEAAIAALEALVSGVAVGRHGAKYVKCTYTTAAGVAVGDVALGAVSIPMAGMVTRFFYGVTIAFTSAGGLATLAFKLGAEPSGTLLAAAVVGTNGSLGSHDGTAITPPKFLTGARIPTMTIGVENLIAGAATFWVEYVD